MCIISPRTFISLLILFSCKITTASVKAPGGKLSTELAFTENKGQITDQYHNLRSDIDFKLSTPGITVFIGDGHLHYQWSKANGNEAVANVAIYRMDVTLMGADKNAMVVAEEIQQGKETYYFPGVCKDGITALQYRKLTYKNIYPNIDWVLYSNGTSLKYDFIVHSGAKLSDIKLKFDGATSLQLDNGSFMATTPYGTITEQKPYCYIAETGETVMSKFILQKEVLSFDVMQEVKGKLVIDPFVEWATYFGGSLDESEGRNTVDVSGNVYLYGNTLSINNIATTGTFQTVFTGTRDGYITKFNKNGQRIWATYFGGSGSNSILCCDIDKMGNVFAVGWADSGLVPVITAGAHQSIYGNVSGSDGFLVKFDGNGQRVWATYYGGAANDTCKVIACDAPGNVYIAGQTFSSNNIATPGTQKTTISGFSAFLAKFDGNGQRLWGTYHGGTDGSRTICSDICTDNSDNVIMGGFTASASTASFTTTGCYQTTLSGMDDGFISKYNKTNGTFIWSTYYGGNKTDKAVNLAVDKTGNIYIIGTTDSKTFAGSPGSYQDTLSGYPAYSDCFIAKFNTSGQRLWGTYYGGYLQEWANNIAWFKNKITIWGFTDSYNGITTQDAQYTSIGINGHSDFIAHFDTNGKRLYGSYFTLYSTSWLSLSSISQDTFDNFYCSHITAATGLATPGAYQTAIQGFRDALLVKIIPGPSAAINQPFTDTSFCSGASFTVNYTVSNISGNFNPGNTFTVQLSDYDGSFASPINLGFITSTVSGSINCTIPPWIKSGKGYRIRIVATSPTYISHDNDKDIEIKKPAPPEVGIVTIPGTETGPFIKIVFAAVPVDGGTAPTFQWRKNGVDIPGATSDVYSGIMGVDFETGDVITVKMISNDTCVMPDSAIGPLLTIKVNLSVTDLETGALKVYPNPTNDLLYITGVNEATDLTVYNALGQVILHESQPAMDKHTISFKGVPAGMYILKTQTASETETVRISVQGQ